MPELGKPYEACLAYAATCMKECTKTGIHLVTFWDTHNKDLSNEILSV